jgi:hypothetical protein
MKSASWPFFQTKYTLVQASNFFLKNPNIWSDLLATVYFLLYTPAWHQVPLYGSLPWYFNHFVPISTYFLFSLHLSLNNNSFFLSHLALPYPKLLYYIPTECQKSFVPYLYLLKHTVCQLFFIYLFSLMDITCLCWYSMCQHMYLCYKQLLDTFNGCGCCLYSICQHIYLCYTHSCILPYTLWQHWPNNKKCTFYESQR